MQVISAFMLLQIVTTYVKIEVFYGTQYHSIPQVENDSYVIEN
jgi:hypothetical protein